MLDRGKHSQSLTSTELTRATRRSHLHLHSMLALPKAHFRLLDHRGKREMAEERRKAATRQWQVCALRDIGKSLLAVAERQQCPLVTALGISGLGQRARTGDVLGS